MSKVTFITGNSEKLEYYREFFDYPFVHKNLEVEEIQSLDIRKVAEHKAREAYAKIKEPVIIDDIALSFEALGGKLPGPLIKWFLLELKPEGLTKLLNQLGDRRARVDVCVVYFDGKKLEFFEGTKGGQIAETPRKGVRGHGWDVIFIPEGSTKTYSELSHKETIRYGVRPIHIFPRLRKLFLDLDRIK